MDALLIAPAAEQSRGAGDSAALVLRAQAAALSHGLLAESATAIAAELAQALGCERVSVGMLERDAVVVVATSQGQEVDTRRDAFSAISAAMNEALDQSATIAFPQAVEGPPPITIAHQMLASAIPGGSGVACTVPVKGRDKVVGAITLERARAAFSPQELLLCEDVASFAGPVLELKREAQRPWYLRLADWVRYLFTPRPGETGATRRIAIAVALAALAVMLLIPVPYRVSAPARLEGSVQRAIVAASDGFLQQANVRAGDKVKEGDVLAEMASQDLLLERKRRESELRQHENAYRTAQARNDRPQMVISQSKAAEAQAMLSLIDSQIERARIQAPFDGIVIKGDLSQNLGAPVQRGEVLMTLSPNDSFRLIVEVDESDIASVEPGQRGHLALAAIPDRVLDIRTKRIVPVATSADARNFFEVESSLDATTAPLRPGLRGVAKIDAGYRPILWMLTHRAWDWLRLSLWSIGL